MQEKGNAMTAPNTILVRLVGTPKCPILIDARPTHDFDADPRLIPSSVRCGPDKLTDLLAVGAEHSAIVVCQTGSSLSQGVAALLRLRRISAEVLEGGFEAWRQASRPWCPSPRFHLLMPRG